MKRIAEPTTLFVVVGLCLTSLYFFIDPATSYFVPKCPFKMLTGYDCPSCGIQRVFYSLLHGKIIEAVKLNPFLFIISPYLFAVLYSAVFKNRFAVAIRSIVCHRAMVYTYIALYLLWWIARNTEYWQAIANA